MAWEIVAAFIVGGIAGVFTMALMNLARPDRIDPRSFDPDGVTFIGPTM